MFILSLRREGDHWEGWSILYIIYFSIIISFSCKEGGGALGGSGAFHRISILKFSFTLHHGVHGKGGKALGEGSLLGEAWGGGVGTLA